jgi:thiamine biosynthesis lipoprotein
MMRMREARVLLPVQLTDLPPLPALDAEVVSLAGATMGTRWSVKCVAAVADSAALQSLIQAALDRIVEQMSTWLPSSDLCRFNGAPAGCECMMPADFSRVLGAALELARDTGGAYDPTAGALVDLWGFGPAPRRVSAPSAAAIRAALEFCGWRRLRFDAARARIIQPGGMHLDLSSIAKGHGVDRICELLRESGLVHFLVEVGGELRGQGCKPDGMPWWVDIERGDDAAFAPLRVALHGLAIATSGDARRFFRADGRRYSHTIDPRTGWPIPEAVASVTVLHRECLQADALATAIAVLGVRAGMEFATHRDVAVRIVERTDAGAREWMTVAFAAMLE